MKAPVMKRLLGLCGLSLTLAGAVAAEQGGAARSEPSPRAAAEPAPRPAQAMFVNAKVSARTVALNQPVRIEFFTGARQIENIDIPAAIAAGVAMASGRMWRLVGRPTVTENEKIRTVQVAFSLVARASGEVPLPRFPLTWLSGDPIPDFGSVKVDANLVVSGEARPLPKEVDGVGGHPWGSRLDAVLAKEAPGLKAEERDGVQALRPRKELELRFRQGDLAEATLDAPGLTLDQAQASFLDRWGMPQSSEGGTLVWVLGWTRISASAVPEGVRIQLVREDLTGKAAAGQVKKRVFDALEGGR
jgi:hypothetical protein